MNMKSLPPLVVLQEAIKYYKRVLDLRPGDYECTLSDSAVYNSMPHHVFCILL